MLRDCGIFARQHAKGHGRCTNVFPLQLFSHAGHTANTTTGNSTARDVRCAQRT